MKKILSVLMVIALVLTGLLPAAVAEKATPEVFEVLIVRDESEQPDFLSSDFMKAMEESAGVKIEWQIFHGSDWDEQRSLLLAAQDLPDAFFGSNCKIADVCVRNPELFVELTDLIPQYMPNLSKAFEADKTLLSTAQELDGKIYGLPRKRPFAPVTASGLYVNKKWLDNLNLEVPDTYEDFADMLRAFKEQDADGDGDPNNEIPMSSYNLYGIMNMYKATQEILSPFGIMTCMTPNYMMLKDGTPVFMPASETYKQAVIWMHDLFAEGVLDPEWFTQDASMYHAKLENEGGSLVGCFYGYTLDSGAGNNADEFVQVPMLKGPDGNRYAMGYDNMNYTGGQFFITSKCKSPEKLLAWVDGFYTNEASLQTNYGPVPECITANEDGTYTVFVPEGEASLDGSAWGHSFRDYTPAYMEKEFEDQVTLPTDEGDGLKLLADKVDQEWVVNPFPNVKMTADQSNELALISTDITMFAEAQFAQWIMYGGIEDQWEGYLAQLEMMQLSKYVQIYTDAYNATMQLVK